MSKEGPMPNKVSFAVGTIIAGLLFVMPARMLAGQLEAVPAVPIPFSNPQTPEKIELGKKLFFDRRLSGDGTMNCATCHDPEHGFSDGLPLSQSYPTTRNWRNAPTLYNACFNKTLFHDGRAGSLEEQALFPMMSAFEMNRNPDYAEEVIRSVPEYDLAFKNIFGGPVTRERMAMAIAAFERTLLSLNSPVDRFLKGDQKALSPEALHGYEIFMGKGGCSACHDGVNLADNRFYALNVPENRDVDNDPRIAVTRRFVAKVSHFDDYLNLQEDPGRYLVTKEQKDWKAFRTPTLREIAQTAPYMHNGVFGTLDEVIDFFDQGGGKGNSALKPLRLTAEEKKALKVFLVEGLTSEQKPFIYPKVP
jgi:cytochrome c peroxidase